MRILRVGVGRIQTVVSKVEKAARELVEKLDKVHKNPAYVGVWTVSQIHQGPYQGPNYTEELKKLKDALKEAEIS